MSRPLGNEGRRGDVISDRRVQSGPDPYKEARDHQHVDPDPRPAAPVEEADQGEHDVAADEGEAAEESNRPDSLDPVDQNPKQGSEDHLCGGIASNNNAVLQHGGVRVQLDHVGVDSCEDDAAAKRHDEKGEVSDVKRPHSYFFLSLGLQGVFQGGEDVKVGRGLPLLQRPLRFFLHRHGAPPP